MDDIFAAIVKARTAAIETWLAKNEVTVEMLETTHVLDFETLPNGDEKLTLTKKEPVDTTVISYTIGYGRDK
jgi:hypothetical protein